MTHRAAWALAFAIVAGIAWLVYGQRVLPSEEAYRQNNIGVARLEQYDYPAATAAFRLALEISSALTIARLNLSIALFYAGDLEAAAREARQAADAMPAAPRPLYVLGLIARADNRPADAMAAFSSVLKLDANDVGARVQLGQVLLAERQFQEAAQMFEAAQAREPFNATAAYGVAMSLTRAGQREAGQAAMARFQALRDNPSSITYSSTYLEQGRYAEAVVSTGLEAELVETAVPPVSFTDATATILGIDRPQGSATLFDRDADGDLDVLLVAAEGVQLLDNERGRFTPRQTFDRRTAGATAAIAGDVDNDGRVDLLLIGGGTDRLYRQETDGSFGETTWQSGAAGEHSPTRTAAFVDIDHDGDLDIFAAPPNRLLRNNGNGTFADVTREAKLSSDAETMSIVPTDYDNRRDVDLLLLSPKSVALMANLRDGTFRDVASDTRLPTSLAYTAVTTGDVNKDHAPDFAFAQRGSPVVVATSDGAGGFTVTRLPSGSADATAVQLFDYDNDGLLDLLALTPAGPRLWRHVGASWTDVSAPALKTLASSKEPPVGATAGDLDQDGDVDLVVRFSNGRLGVWRNDDATGHSSLRVRLASRVSNRSAIGAKVEVRAGSLRDRLEVSSASPPVAPAGLQFGLGARPRADVVRVLWPAGILQAETDLEGGTLTIQELDRKPSSCPFLFTWNGSRFEFVTDFLGGGEMGYWVSPGVRNVPDSDEYVRIRSDQLNARDGRYELRVTNELEEAVFLDKAQLLVLTHPVGTDVYPNEGLRSPAALGPFAIHTTRAPRPPHGALDHHGHDVLDRLTAIDRRYVDDFRREAIQGYAEEHALYLNLGTVPEGAPVRLLLTGWTDYAFSSDNVAAHQAGLAFRPPSLEIKHRDGTWRTAVAELGLPVGRPQTVVVDLTPHLAPYLTARESIDVRIMTTLRVYWDQVLVDTSAPASYRLTRLDAIDAQLRWRGFSAETSPDGRAPFTYDYDGVSRFSPWKIMPGRYTREGDVGPLVASVDDQFVVAAPGDEIALVFDAAALPPLADGWTRTFLFYADGFSKEMNLHSSSPDRLEPLPFHAMSGYPYVAPEHYPSTPEHDRYRAHYNTRIIGGPLPPLIGEGR